MTEMLRLSTEVHEKVIRYCYPNVTDEEGDEIIFNYPSFSPLYYLEWWDENRSMMIGDWGDLDLDYERVARDVIRSLDPIKLVIIENLALFDDDDHEDLVDFKLNECVDTHRRLIMRINNPELNNSNDSDDDIGDDWRR